MRLGPCVTNPAVRDLTVTASLFATLNLISGGRMELGIGRGDSSRRVLGKKPVTPAELERAVVTFRELTAGREVQYDGQPARLTWASGSPPVWIAGYGPKVLSMAGTNRGWRDSAIRRSRPDCVVPGIRAAGRKGSGPRSQDSRSHGGGPGLGVG